MTSSPPAARWLSAGRVLGVLGVGVLALGGLAWFVGAPVGNVCTLLAAGPVLRVGFGEPIAAPGLYRLRVQADGEAMSCEVQVPLQGGAAPACRGFTVEGVDGGMGTMSFQQAHRHLSVAIERNGAVVRRGTFEPRYRRFEPNGPGCGVQEIAERLTLRWPAGGSGP